MRCVGSESRITDCRTTNYTYEQGKQLAEHLPVAGVACRPQHCCECSLSTVELLPTNSECSSRRPTQLAQPDCATDNSELTVTIILLTCLTAISGAVSVTLAA